MRNLNSKTASKNSLRVFFIVIVSLFSAGTLKAQTISNTGCVSGKFGIDAGLYSGTVEYGAGTPALNSNDWFPGSTGWGVIDTTNTKSLTNFLKAPGNPTYLLEQAFPHLSIKQDQILIDALFARDYFGGTGFTDATAYLTSNKNGEDPAIWDAGTANVLGKNDIIDVGGHMFRLKDAGDNNPITLENSDLWFVGLFNNAEPGGASYMDFEFFVKDVQLSSNKFTSGGPQLGHTAYNFVADPLNPGKHKISKVGDFIFSVAMEGGVTSVLDTRIWVSRAEWQSITPLTFTWSGTFDGAFNGAPYGYAGILPLNDDLICGYVNKAGELPMAPPWGTRGTKTNTWNTRYAESSLTEVAINLTTLGMDHSTLSASGIDRCYFPLNTFLVKTRTSSSFTASLKDFSGPFKWGGNGQTLSLSTDFISCETPAITVSASPGRSDITYAWSTIDGSFVAGPNPWQIIASKPGTYKMLGTLPTSCPTEELSIDVTLDPTKPLFSGPVNVTKTVSCNGNDGSITVSVSGGTAPFTYTWTKNGSPYTVTSSPTITGLAAGTYRVTVKGLYACEIISADIVVAAKTAVALSPTLTHVNCSGGTTGAINLGLTGGDTPLSYLWSNGNTTQNLTGIGAGNYSVTITDVNGCTTSANYTINETNAITGTIDKADDTDPSTTTGTGTATLTPSGGTGPYTFAWVASETGIIPSGQVNNQNLTLLDYGRYTVTITDANGCTGTATVYIYEPEVCNDGIDNDGDGLNNCDDSECQPAAPVSITPSDTNPCVGETVTYTTPTNASYDSYQWIYPGNTTYVSGQGTNTLTLTWTSTAGGQICVYGKKYDCESVSTCISVNVKAAPPIPGSILITNN